MVEEQHAQDPLQEGFEVGRSSDHLSRLSEGFEANALVSLEMANCNLFYMARMVLRGI